MLWPGSGADHAENNMLAGVRLNDRFFEPKSACCYVPILIRCINESNPFC